MEPSSTAARFEVSGDCIGAILDGFRQYPTVALKYMAKYGIIGSESKAPSDLDRSAWYPLESWLAAYKGIAEEVGANSMFAIGKRIPQNAQFPPHVVDVHSAIQSINVAYHMNHRKDGTVMFNPGTGAMLDGIGRYVYEKRGDRSIACACENPYPCDFDRGLVSAMAQRFEELSRTEHDDAAPCRKKGGSSCTFVVTW
jgi:hypothetical protein